MTATCPRCGQAFVPRRASQRYCDAVCQARAARAAYARRHPAKQRAWERISRDRRRAAAA